MKDNYSFLYNIAFEKDTKGFTIRTPDDLSLERFIPIAGFNTYEQAEYFLDYIKKKGGIDFLNDVILDRVDDSE